MTTKPKVTIDWGPCCEAKHSRTGEQCVYVPRGHGGIVHRDRHGNIWGYGPDGELFERRDGS